MKKMLSVGDAGNDVATIHKLLKSHGFSVPAAEVERTFFGPGTRAALGEFQRTKGISESCEVYEKTAAVLGAAPSGLAQPVRESPQPAPAPISPRAGARVTGEEIEDQRPAFINPGERELPIAEVHLPERASLLVPIIAPIRPGDKGPQVANLQGALLALLERKIIRALNGRDRPSPEDLQKLTEGLKQERAQSLFGASTTQLVIYFQVQQDIGDNLYGVVEDKTAAKLNEWLRKLGLFDLTESGGFVVRGTVNTSDGQPLSGAVVRAFDRDLRQEQPLGEAVTNEGKYEILYSDQQFRRAEKGSADLVIKAFAANDSLLAASPVLFNAPPSANVDLTIPAENWRTSWRSTVSSRNSGLPCWAVRFSNSPKIKASGSRWRQFWIPCLRSMPPPCASRSPALLTKKKFLKPLGRRLLSGSRHF